MNVKVIPQVAYISAFRPSFCLNGSFARVFKIFSHRHTHTHTHGTTLRKREVIRLLVRLRISLVDSTGQYGEILTQRSIYRKFLLLGNIIMWDIGQYGKFLRMQVCGVLPEPKAILHTSAITCHIAQYPMFIT